MKRNGEWPVGVCSWSLQRDLDGVAEALSELGLAHVHLDVGPTCGEQPDGYLEQVRRRPWTISATMIGFPQEDYSTLESIRRTGGIVPDEMWDANRKRFLKAIEATAALRVPYLSSHFGFLGAQDPDRARIFRRRVLELADAAAEHRVTLLMETGQESAWELKEFLQALAHPALGVNFDPANMILYGMGDPVEGVRILAPWVKHLHIKDAVGTEHPGTWGRETVWGAGQVGTERFLTALKSIGYKGVLAIEREGGDDRLGDIRIAAGRLADFQ